MKQTRKIDKTLNPMWNETFELDVVDELNDVIDFDVYDWDRFSSNDLLGVCHVPVASVTGVGVLDKWIPLIPRHSATLNGQPNNLGELHVKVCIY